MTRGLMLLLPLTEWGPCPCYCSCPMGAHAVTRGLKLLLPTPPMPLLLLLPDGGPCGDSRAHAATAHTAHAIIPGGAHGPPPEARWAPRPAAA